MKVTECKDLLSKLDQVDTQNCLIVGHSFAVIFEGTVSNCFPSHRRKKDTSARVVAVVPLSLQPLSYRYVFLPCCRLRTRYFWLQGFSNSTDFCEAVLQVVNTRLKSFLSKHSSHSILQTIHVQNKKAVWLISKAVVHNIVTIFLIHNAIHNSKL